MGAGVLDFGFEFAAGGHEGFDPFDDGGLLGERRKRKKEMIYDTQVYILLSGSGRKLLDRGPRQFNEHPQELGRLAVNRRRKCSNAVGDARGESKKPVSAIFAAIVMHIVPEFPSRL